MKVRHWIACLLAIGGVTLGGCAVSVEPGHETGEGVPIGVVDQPGTLIPDPELSAAADEHLARLQALDLFEVGDLIVEAPPGSMNCYGPCPGFEDEIAAVQLEQEQRLAQLVDIAESTRAAESLDPNLHVGVDSHLEALASLQIVAVGEMMVSEAAPSPYCYNLVCPGDEERVAEENARREAEIAVIAEKAASELH